MTDYENAVRDVIAAAGGRLVGKTRLQKTAYILKIAGLSPDFSYTYHFYGPYSEDVASATKDAVLDQLIIEDEVVAQWGGTFSIFTTPYQGPVDERSRRLVTTACDSDPVTLELAATAAFLKGSGIPDWWEETQRRKPQKATAERLALAKALWNRLRAIQTPIPLPAL
ncbi:MAG: hypothetical protein EON91_04610 [Brevundimonas sp.]|uniref:hypothetical protein n=1 Tax=Brevundimonas sp. TaxID=1871086 RepID=UPI00121F9EA9|nr:hypothetical protein [Brevundimonas sp.]RZJ18615.1 MAG: hypothetical protein EON91_04610 [Brevundimonas sp.]